MADAAAPPPDDGPAPPATFNFADIWEAVWPLVADRTALLISHRLSTVRMADEIAYLEHGRVVERGTHDELVGAGGRYAELWDLQARRFRTIGDTP